jgi:hypothetical protein
MVSGTGSLECKWLTIYLHGILLLWKPKSTACPQLPEQRLPPSECSQKHALFNLMAIPSDKRTRHAQICSSVYR